MTTKELKTLLIIDEEVSLLIASVEHYQKEIASRCKKEGDVNTRRYDTLEGLRTALYSL
jgi:hypothetical protein